MWLEMHINNFLTSLPTSSFGYFTLAASLILLKQSQSIFKTFQKLPFSPRVDAHTFILWSYSNITSPVRPFLTTYFKLWIPTSALPVVLFALFFSIALSHTINAITIPYTIKCTNLLCWFPASSSRT